MTRTATADAFLASALLITVLSVVGALTLRTTFGKLHYITPISTVAGPLFGAALVIHTGWGITAGLQILIICLVAISGPVLEMAIGRVEAQRQGLLEPEGPQ